jgi:hypothetical protein
VTDHNRNLIDYVYENRRDNPKWDDSPVQPKDIVEIMMAQKITHLLFNDYDCGYIEMTDMKSEFLLLKNHYIMNEYLTPFVSKYTQGTSRGRKPRNGFKVDDFIAHLLDLIKRRKETTKSIREKGNLEDFQVKIFLENYHQRFETLRGQLIDIID